DLYLRAEYQANRGAMSYDSARLKEALALYRQAIAEDPRFARALARLSCMESLLAWFGGGGLDVADLNRRAEADADRALELAGDLAAARLAVGYSAYWGRGDFTAALEAFDAALAVSPNDADALVA